MGAVVPAADADNKISVSILACGVRSRKSPALRNLSAQYPGVWVAVKKNVQKCLRYRRRLGFVVSWHNKQIMAGFALACKTSGSGHTIHAMTTEPCTQKQRADIVRAAEQRAHYILWIAEKLTITDDALIRKEAAKLLRELVGK
jgi:hypothetical protein